MLLCVTEIFMNKIHIIIYLSSIVIGVLIGIFISKKEYFPIACKYILNRIDKTLQDSNQLFSSTRANNMLWNIGNFAIITISIFSGKIIPDPILFFMGSAMGLTNTQAIFNKRAEVKQVIETTKKEDENV